MILVACGAGFIGTSFALGWVDQCNESAVNLDQLTVSSRTSKNSQVTRVTNSSVAISETAPCCQSKPRAVGQSYATQITFVQDRPGYDRRYAIDAPKLKRNRAGNRWRLSRSLQETVQSYRDNWAWVTHVASGEYLNWVELQFKQ